MIFGLLIAVVCVPGWNVIAEVQSDGSPVDCYMDEDGSYHLEILSDPGTREYIFNADGESIGIRECFPIDSLSGTYSFTALPVKVEGCSHGIDFAVNGDTVWTADLGFSTFDGEFPGMVIPSVAGGCCAVFSPSVNQGIWRAARLDSSGETVFDSGFQLLGGPVISLNDMAEMADGGVVLTGVTDRLGMNLNMFLIGISQSGELLFHKSDSLRFHGSGEIVQADTQGITVAGYTGYERDDGFFMPPVETDVFIIRFDKLGNELWRSVAELPLENSPLAMSLSSDGSVLLAVSAFSHEVYDPGKIVLLNYCPRQN